MVTPPPALAEVVAAEAFEFGGGDQAVAVEGFADAEGAVLDVLPHGAGGEPEFAGCPGLGVVGQRLHCREVSRIPKNINETCI